MQTAIAREDTPATPRATRIVGAARDAIFHANGIYTSQVFSLIRTAVIYSADE